MGNVVCWITLALINPPVSATWVHNLFDKDVLMLKHNTYSTINMTPSDDETIWRRSIRLAGAGSVHFNQPPPRPRSPVWGSTTATVSVLESERRSLGTVEQQNGGGRAGRGNVRVDVLGVLLVPWVPFFLLCYCQGQLVQTGLEPRLRSLRSVTYHTHTHRHRAGRGEYACMLMQTRDIQVYLYCVSRMWVKTKQIRKDIKLSSSNC